MQAKVKREQRLELHNKHKHKPDKHETCMNMAWIRQDTVKLFRTRH